MKREIKIKVKVSEADIQHLILDYLHKRKIFCWRTNSGVFFLSYKGKSRAVRAGIEGISDIVGILPDGKFLAVEVKRKGGKPTDNQKAFLNKIIEQGGLACVAYDLEDVRVMLVDYLF